MSTQFLSCKCLSAQSLTSKLQKIHCSLGKVKRIQIVKSKLFMLNACLDECFKPLKLQFWLFWLVCMVGCVASKKWENSAKCQNFISIIVNKLISQVAASVICLPGKKKRKWISHSECTQRLLQFSQCLAKVIIILLTPQDCQNTGHDKQRETIAIWQCRYVLHLCTRLEFRSLPAAERCLPTYLRSRRRACAFPFSMT